MNILYALVIIASVARADSTEAAWSTFWGRSSHTKTAIAGNASLVSSGIVDWNATLRGLSSISRVPLVVIGPSGRLYSSQSVEKQLNVFGVEYSA